MFQDSHTPLMQYEWECKLYTPHTCQVKLIPSVIYCCRKLARCLHVYFIYFCDVTHVLLIFLIKCCAGKNTHAWAVQLVQRIHLSHKVHTVISHGALISFTHTSYWLEVTTKHSSWSFESTTHYWTNTLWAVNHSLCSNT